jgi:hypothetical protein
MHGGQLPTPGLAGEQLADVRGEGPSASATPPPRLRCLPTPRRAQPAPHLAHRLLHRAAGHGRKLEQVVPRITGNAGSLACAAEEVSATAQSLAQASNGRAAAVEETSARSSRSPRRSPRTPGWRPRQRRFSFQRGPEPTIIGPRSPMNCAHCRRSIEPGALHYRFAVELEGEQLALDDGAPGGADALAQLLAQLEAGPDDPSSYEAQVHWEQAGALCVGCRAQLMTFFGAEPPAPH